MAVADLVLNLLAKDNASREVDKVKHSLTGLEKAQSGLGRASQLLGAGAIVAFGVSSVKAYADAEKSQVKLQEAYRKFPKLADVNIESLRQLNTALQDKTGSDDDDLAAAEANLAMFGLTGTQIKQLIPLVNDLAVAKGIGLTEASKSVGKAMLGNAKALKDVGIQFKATGDKAKDFGTISDALSAQVGGAGDAFGKTAAGGMARAQKSFSDLQEEVGKQLVPALSTVLQAVLPVMRAFNGLSDAVKGPIVWVGVLGAAALVLAPKLLGIVANMKLIQANSAAAALALEAEAAAAVQAGGASAAATGKLAGLSRGMKGIGVAGAALAVGLPLVGQLVNSIGENMFGAAPSAEKLREQLIGISEGADANKIGNFGGKLHDLGAEIEHLDNPGVMQRIEDFFGSLGGQGGGQGRNQVLRDIALINQEIAALAGEGKIDQARAALDALEQSARDAGTSEETITRQYQYAEDAIAAARRTTNSLTTAIDGTTNALEGQGNSLGTNTRLWENWYNGAGLVAETQNRIATETAAAIAALEANRTAAQDALSTWTESIATYNTERDALKALTDARQAEVLAISGQMTAGGKLNNVFDMNAYAAASNTAADARRNLADAEKAVRASRADVRNAQTPQELNAAIAAEAQANKALAASRAEVTAADKAKEAAKLTPGHLLANIKSKLSNIKSFYNDLVALRKRKLPMSLIQQLIDAGPIEGDQLAKALLSATPHDFNAIMNAETQLDQFGNRIGAIVADYDYNGLIANQRTVVANARAAAVNAGRVVGEYRLYLDGREVATALKAYRQSIGGTPLGLG